MPSVLPPQTAREREGGKGENGSLTTCFTSVVQPFPATACNRSYFLVDGRRFLCQLTSELTKINVRIAPVSEICSEALSAMGGTSSGDNTATVCRL